MDEVYQELMSRRHAGHSHVTAIPASENKVLFRTSGASIILHPKAAEALRDWISSRPGVRPHEYLFPSQRCPTRPFDRRWAWAGGSGERSGRPVSPA